MGPAQPCVCHCQTSIDIAEVVQKGWTGSSRTNYETTRGVDQVWVEVVLQHT